MNLIIAEDLSDKKMLNRQIFRKHRILRYEIKTHLFDTFSPRGWFKMLLSHNFTRYFEKVATQSCVVLIWEKFSKLTGLFFPEVFVLMCLAHRLRIQPWCIDIMKGST